MCTRELKHILYYGRKFMGKTIITLQVLSKKTIRIKEENEFIMIKEEEKERMISAKIQNIIT